MTMKKLDIIYEDKYLIAVNKPAKLLSIASNKEKEKTLYHEVSLYVKKKHKSNKIFIVHRLDFDTSGVIVFAKDEKIKTILQSNWENKDVTREYLALVKGKIKPIKATLKNKLFEDKTHMVYVNEHHKDAKLAITSYELVGNFNDYSLVKIKIETGRKNQIRVQLNHIGYPIVGDSKYGKVKSQYNRLMLHASKLIFTHPITKEKLELIAKIPKEFPKFM